MQHPKSLTLLLLTGVVLSISCKKSIVGLTPISSLYLINATVNLGSVKANFVDPSNKGNGQYYSQIASIRYGGNASYPVLAGQIIPLTIVPVTDTVNPIYRANLNLGAGNIYTLFLAGKAGSMDTVFVRESMPFYADSICGIRWINLSYNSSPITISQAITPTVNEVSNLAYKTFSSFKPYSAGASNSSYVFQVRDAATSTLLATYTLSTPFFHNVTLAWIGEAGGSGASAQKVIRINHY